MTAHAVRHVQIIGVPMDLGASRRGTDMGPSALRIAGLGSALVGSVSTLLSVLFGVLVAGAYDETVLPLVAGFALLGLASLATMHWTDAGLAPEH